MVLLVPRQIRMTGMTGSVPYYGGRLTPAQAHAASQARRQAPPPPPPPRHPVDSLNDLLAAATATRSPTRRPGRGGRRPPGGIAAVALIEHLWAESLVGAIGAARGRPLGELWLSAEDRARL